MTLPVNIPSKDHARKAKPTTKYEQKTAALMFTTNPPASHNAHAPITSTTPTEHHQ